MLRFLRSATGATIPHEMFGTRKPQGPSIDPMRLITRTAALALGVSILLAGCGKSAAGRFAGQWTDAGSRPLPRAPDALVLEVVEGCDPAVVFLYLAWPPGTPTSFKDGDVRQFIRDSRSHVSETLAREFDPDADLPASAHSTEFRHGPWELWVDPSDEESVYLVSEGRTERWPRSPNRVACA
jgi:hypothetical protein